MALQVALFDIYEVLQYQIVQTARIGERKKDWIKGTINDSMMENFNAGTKKRPKRYFATIRIAVMSLIEYEEDFNRSDVQF